MSGRTAAAAPRTVPVVHPSGHAAVSQQRRGPGRLPLVIDAPGGASPPWIVDHGQRVRSDPFLGPPQPRAPHCVVCFQSVAGDLVDQHARNARSKHHGMFSRRRGTCADSFVCTLDDGGRKRLQRLVGALAGRGQDGLGHRGCGCAGHGRLHPHPRGAARVGDDGTTRARDPDSLFEADPSGRHFKILAVPGHLGHQVPQPRGCLLGREAASRTSTVLAVVLRLGPGRGHVYGRGQEPAGVIRNGIREVNDPIAAERPAGGEPDQTPLDGSGLGIREFNLQIFPFLQKQKGSFRSAPFRADRSGECLVPRRVDHVNPKTAGRAGNRFVSSRRCLYETCNRSARRCLA